MAVQKGLGAVGVALQAAKGTAAGNPTFMHGVLGGSGFDLDVTQDLAPIVTATRTSPGVDRTGVRGKFDVQFRCHPRSLGLWLYAALGSKAVTGAGPYTHTITPGATGPLLTTFANIAGIYRALQDCVVTSLEIAWDETGIVTCSVQGEGTIANFAPTFTPTTDDTNTAYLRSNSGTAANMKFSAYSTAATAPIKAGSIKITNVAGFVQLSHTIVPQDVYSDRQSYEAMITVVPPANLDDWRAAVTGTTSGTTAAEDTVYGAFDVTFVAGAASLQLAAPRVAYAVGYPQLDPSGGHVELPFAGLPVPTTAGAVALTATLINTQTSYVGV
jgi:hypothetical protein